MIVLVLAFQVGWLLFLFAAWLLCLELPMLCWIEVVKVDTLILFLMLGRKVLVFAHWVDVGCRFLVCGLNYVEVCSLFFPSAECFYYKRVVYFMKCFCSIYWYDHVIFVFPLVYVMYYIYWLTNIVPSLHPWDEYHLIMVYDFLTYCWVQFANNLLMILVFMFIRNTSRKI